MDIAEHSSTKKNLKNVSSYRGIAVDVNDGTYLNHEHNHRVNTILPSSTRHSGKIIICVPLSVAGKYSFREKIHQTAKVKSSVPSQPVSVLVPISLNHEQRTVPTLSKGKEKQNKHKTHSFKIWLHKAFVKLKCPLHLVRKKILKMHLRRWSCWLLGQACG